MTIALRSPSLPRTSQAAEGLERRRWSVAEIEAMVLAGIIDEDEHFELIGGEIVPLSPKGNRHELLKVLINRNWAKTLPADVWMAQETTFRLDEDTFLEPDFVFFTEETGIPNLNGDTALLAVEISHSSLGYDLGRKARLYATFNIRELWVIDAVKLVVHVYRSPGMNGYGEKFEVSATQEIKALHAPGVTLRLAGFRQL